MTEVILEDALNRFLKRVAFTERCWFWTGGISANGYGKFYWARQMHCAHRWLYETINGPIPDGYEPHHICRVRPCVNLDHLRAIPIPDHRRGHHIFRSAPPTHCKNGHEFTESNIYRWAKHPERRYCVICKRAGSLRAYYKRKGN